MTKEQLAIQLHGGEYGDEVNAEQRAEAKKHGLVIIYGASDDLCEIDGAIRDETCGSGRFEFRLSQTGLIEEPDDEEREVLEKFRVLEAVTKKGAIIKVIWADEGYSWTYETDIPHATFDVLEDGEKYCRGIVFNLSDLPE